MDKERKESFENIADIILDLQQGGSWFNRIFEYERIQKKLLNTPTQETLDFLCAYAEKAENNIKKENSFAEEAIEVYNLAKKIAKIRENDELVKAIDKKIFDIGERANTTREAGNKSESNFSVMLQAYKTTSIDTRQIELETAEDLLNKLDTLESREARNTIINLYCGQRVKQAKRIAEKLNEQFNKSESEFKDEWKFEHHQGYLIEISRQIAHNKPKLYNTIAQYLAQDLRGRVKYEGTNIFCTSEAKFEMPKNLGEIINLTPDDWNYLGITLNNPEGIEGSINTIENGIPTSLGISGEGTSKYDKSQTPTFIERDGVYEQYNLLAKTPEEIKRIKEELLPAVLDKGYSIKGILAGRAHDPNNIRDFSSHDKVWKTRICTTRVFKQNHIELKTSEKTKAEEVVPFANNLNTCKIE